MQNIVYLTVDDLLEPETPIRLNANDESIQDLAKSIRRIGLLQPLLVRKEGLKYKVVCGHRRYLACVACKLEKIPCIVTNDIPENDLEKMLTENIARKDMSPVEEAASFKEALEKLDHTPHSLAESIGRSTEYVKRRLRILDYPAEIQQALHEKQITLAVAEWLAQIEDEDVRNRYLCDAIERQISAKTAEFWYHTWLENRNYKEKGVEDPRAAEYQPSPSQIYGTCELCGEKEVFSKLASVVLCKRCRQLINLFWEEYNRHDRNNPNRVDSICPSNVAESRT